MSGITAIKPIKTMCFAKEQEGLFVVHFVRDNGVYRCSIQEQEACFVALFAKSKCLI